MAPTTIKTTGYLISTASVLLLGAVAWESATKDPDLMLCLVGGMAASIVGMLLRWISYRLEK